MSIITALLSPSNLLFLIIFAGFAIGKIRIKGISLGIAGILFVSMLVGFLMNLWIPQTNAEIISSAQNTMKIISKLGTSLFVSVIGLQTGFSIKNNSKSSIIAFAIGACMSISGVMTMLLISVVDKAISYSSLLGVLCGALTSTPGLSSVCELIGDGSEDAIFGYGCSYLLGVVLVVFFTQLSDRSTDEKEAERPQENTALSKIYPELMLISISAFFGGILGNIHIPFLCISIGNTASTLMFGLLVGLFFRRKVVAKSISLQALNTYKTIGLALFFAGTGFNTGMQSVFPEIKTIIYGALITLTAILCGMLLCKIASSRHSLHKGFVIAGGLTSSPAYGAISTKASESNVNHYSLSYFGSLLSLIIALQVIAR